MADDRSRRATGSGTEPKLAERVSEQIRDWILDGRYRPGDKLPPERRLATLLGVNRGSLRLALKRLEQLGLLQARQGDGTRVQDFAQAAGIQLLPYVFRTALRQDPEVLQDVLELRVLLCGYLARLAALRASPTELPRIDAIIDRMEDGRPDPAALLGLDFDLYWELARAGRSFVGQLLLNTVREPFEQNSDLFVSLGDDSAEIVKSARAVAAAVARGDAGEAERLATEYLTEGARRALADRGLSPTAEPTPETSSLDVSPASSRER